MNGCPLALVEPEILRQKVFEPVRLLGEDRFKLVDIRIRVKGGGYVSQIYAIRQVRVLSRGFLFLTRGTGHFQGHCGVLPKVCRRVFQEGDQGDPDELRSFPAHHGLAPARAQEVWRSRRPRPLPKVL